MDRYGVTLFLNIVILTVCIQSGLSLKCYSCNSNLNEKCADTVDKASLETAECAPSLFQESVDAISKGLSSVGNAMGIDVPSDQIGANTKFACQKILITNKDEKIYMRGCTLASSVAGDTCEMSNGVEKLTGGHGKVEFCGTCEDDLCNGTSVKSFTAMFFMLVPCIALVLSRMISA